MTTTQQRMQAFERLEAKIDLVDRKLDRLLEQQRWQREVVDEIAPIARDMMKVGTDHLGELERAGYFAFGREALRILERVVESYSEEDVRQLGDNIVGIMDTARSLTQPAVLSVANDAATALSDPDELQPLGLFGAMRATRNEDVQKGTAVLLEILRRIGRAAPERSPAADNQPAPTAAPRTADTPRGPAAPREPEGREAESCAAESREPGAQAATCPAAAPTGPDAGGNEAKAGWDLCPQGHLANAELWTERFATVMSGALGLGTLSDAQWAVVRAARAEWVETRAAPNIRRLGAVSGVGTRELYALFPKAPARTVAKIAGLPKPAGCL